jgi:hypothetical protein
MDGMPAGAPWDGRWEDQGRLSGAKGFRYYYWAFINLPRADDAANIG